MTEEKNVRVVIYMPPSLARQIKATARLQGIDLSEWVRRKAKEEVDKAD
jgi:predicted HicB family RNase H-like nuclease